MEYTDIMDYVFANLYNTPHTLVINMICKLYGVTHYKIHIHELTL